MIFPQAFQSSNHLSSKDANENLGHGWNLTPVTASPALTPPKKAANNVRFEETPELSHEEAGLLWRSCQVPELS